MSGKLWKATGRWGSRHLKTKRELQAGLLCHLLAAESNDVIKNAQERLLSFGMKF